MATTAFPDVWHAVAEQLNWDFTKDVIEWIVSQPQCDLADGSTFVLDRRARLLAQISQC